MQSLKCAAHVYVAQEFVYALQISHLSYNLVIVLNVREIRPFWPINVQCTTVILMLSSSIKTELNFPSYYSSDNS